MDTIVLFLSIGYAGVLTLGYVRGPRWLRWLGRLLTLAIAVGFSALAIALYRLGDSQHWTGDGPGMLLVAMGLVVAALCALSAWAAVIVQLAGLGPRSTASPALGLSLVAIGVAGTGYGLREQLVLQKPSHDAPVVALQFARRGTRLLSLDEAGTLKTWNTERRAFEAARSLPALAGARALLASDDGRFALALQAGGAQLVDLERSAQPEALPGVSGASLLPGGAVALAAGRELRIVALAAPQQPIARSELARHISALASDAQGRLALALDDGTLLTLDTPDGPARERARLAKPVHRLLASPGGTWLVAIDVDARASALHLPRGELRELPGWIRLEACAFASEEGLVLAGPGDPSALAFSLPDLRSEPWLNYGRPLSALATAPGAPDAAVALGADLLLARAPRGGNAYTSDAARLVHRRF